MTGEESPTVEGLRRVHVGLISIVGKCESSVQTFPHPAAFLASDSFLRAIRWSPIVLGGPLPVLRDAFGSGIISEGHRRGHKLSSIKLPACWTPGALRQCDILAISDIFL